MLGEPKLVFLCLMVVTISKYEFARRVFLAYGNDLMLREVWTPMSSLREQRLEGYELGGYFRE